MWKRNSEGDELRELYELVGDKDALAELDRSNMGQSRQIETTR